MSNDVPDSPHVDRRVCQGASLLHIVGANPCGLVLPEGAAVQRLTPADLARGRPDGEDEVVILDGVPAERLESLLARIGARRSLAVLDAASSAGDRARALAAGATDAVIAPVADNELALRLGRLIAAGAADRERQRLRRELDATAHELERFAYIASHDLKEPLRAVSGFSQLLKDRYSGRLDENADTYLRFISEGAERLGDMIGSLLEYSRISRHRIEITPIDLDELVHRLLSERSDAVAAVGAKVTVLPLPTIHSDLRLITTVVGELLDNALCFADPDRPLQVEVAASPTADGWQFDITDSGIGIADRDQTRVWEMFTRLHPREVYPGTGIGLALVAVAIGRLRGEVSLDSAPDRGTTVSVRLPSLLEAAGAEQTRVS